MTTKTMTVVEEVYRWLESNPEVRVFCTKKVHENLPWLDSNRISSALSLFCKETRLRLIGVTGAQKANVYERTDMFDSPRKFAGKPKFSSRNIKSGTRIPVNEDRDALPELDEDGHPVTTTEPESKEFVTNREILLQKLEELTERQLQLATEIEGLQRFVKNEIIL